MKHIKLFEAFATKEERRDYYRALAAAQPVEDRITNTQELKLKFDYLIPDEIIDHMKTWDVIVKSPHGASFYNSKEISWSYKPDGSFRVSDHWNFITKGSKHCKTDKPVRNTDYVSLGQYDRKLGTYKILLSLQTPKNIEYHQNRDKRMNFLRNPELISLKKDLKDKINSKELHCEITDKDKTYKGIVSKYTGVKLQLVDEQGNTIYNNDEIEKQVVKFFDKDGKSIDNPYDIKFESKRVKTFEAFSIVDVDDSSFEVSDKSNFTKEDVKDIYDEFQIIAKAFNIKFDDSLDIHFPTKEENTYRVGSARNAYIDMVLFTSEEDIVEEIKSFVKKMDNQYGFKIINGWTYKNKMFGVEKDRVHNTPYTRVSLVFYSKSHKKTDRQYCVQTR